MRSGNKISRLVILMPSLLILSLLASGQQKQQLTPKDYELWKKASKIGKGQVSGDGQWIYYSITNEKGDSAFVRNVKTGSQYSFRVSHSGMNINRMLELGSWNFSSNSSWFAVIDADSIRLVNLKTGKKKTYKGATFDFIPTTERIVIIAKENSTESIIIQDLASGYSKTYTGVTAHALNTEISKIAVAINSTGSSRALVIELTGNIKPLEMAAAPTKTFNAFKWNSAGNVVAFIGRHKDSTSNTAENTMYLCNLKNRQPSIRQFTPAELITDDYQKKGRISHLYLSNDGEQLFFDVWETKYPDEDPAAKNKENKPVEIWGAAALQIPIENQKYNSIYWYAWHSDGYLETITNEEFPCAFISGDQKNVMTYHKRGYLPQYKYVNSYADIYLKKRNSDAVKLLVPKVKDQPDEFLTSPTGKYIAYFKQNHWWVYDFEKETHTCITENMNRDWSSDRRTSTGIWPPYGSAGWLKNDEAFLVYDKYDIWLITPDGRTREKITHGQQDNITYRVVEKRRSIGMPGGGNQWFSSSAYNEDEGIFITSMDYDIIENGWWWWTRKKGLSKIIAKEKKIEYLSKPAMGKPLLFTEEDFDLSPRLVLRHPSGKEEILYQTNPQQQNYYWGRSEAIRYKTIDGKDLTAGLLFPANYDPTKKYPMVVEVYETRSKEAHFYIEPSESTDKSNYIINPTVYTAEGYFVLFPDITYQLNEPGISATRCITAAVQAALNKHGIDKNKIGLTGNSFGGYETAFLISQTDMFAAAIAGAGITDLPDFYLGISSFGTNFTRVEEDQFRMQVPFYSEAFSRNSPMHNIDKIKTPILLFTGDEDSNVDWTQSRRLHTALWRLGKKSAMLVYPGENHALQKPENEKDLAMRMKDWFDHYLKGDAPAEWIKMNMGITNK